MKKFCTLFFTIAPLVWSACSAGRKIPSDDWRVAYNVLTNSENDDYDVFVMRPDGSEKHNITRHPDVAWTYFAWKGRLFFISDRDTCRRCYFLYETDAEGRHPRKVTELQLEDSWMSSRHDGRELVVTGRIGKELRMQLFLVDTQTGAFRQITNDTAALHRDPLFAPDGQSIVFAYKKNRRDRQQIEELYRMNPDGSGMRQLTHFPTADSTAPWHSYHAGPPRWNRAENFISYQSFQNGKYSLYAVSPDGARQWKLTDLPLDEGWHDWSPDGRWLFVETFDTGQSQFHIHRLDWKTKALVQLTDTTYKYQQAPVLIWK
ncbi:MAG: PD40 domain-containing protein [Saprospiraceae bacterium]|nr:PD40 domain-containing protein [Saprospiraceae bacterium]